VEFRLAGGDRRLLQVAPDCWIYELRSALQ
jgi:hypothetical protein